jgi:hypothetical protein
MAHVKTHTRNSRGNWNHIRIRKYLSNIPEKHDIKELQKIAILALHTYC